MRVGRAPLVGCHRTSSIPIHHMRTLIRSAPARFALIAFATFLAVSLVTRILLLIAARHELTPDSSVLGIFTIGAGFDAASAVFASIPWLLLGAVAPARFLKSNIGKWTTLSLMALFSALLIFITISEVVFWDEFGARFNFIAVDYLIWTQEVLGNIAESYPMVPIFGGLAAVSIAMAAAMHRRHLFTWASAGTTTSADRILWPLAGFACAAILTLSVSQSAMPPFVNQYHTELAKNGPWSFFAAFRQMELEYTKWYANLPLPDALADTRKLLSTPDASSSTPDPEDLHRTIIGRGPEHPWNVILVCMESMSGDYMDYVGKNPSLTPVLNRLAKESLFFENLYATGTRTVRGMEALTLNLPPTPGQAIIYRPEGINLTTTFSTFIDRGYDCAFFYGGDGRFDFMNRYFSTAGCRIMDIGAWNPADTTFKTSWGACDEDLFNKTLEQADASHAAGKPFHYFCMTTSNHRPYDFPAGRVDAPPHKRQGAIRYADWAVGHLIAQASKRPWFSNTLFVIVSDHCASSAGKMEIDVTKYRIPAMIYNPGLVPPRTVSRLCSQIDLMPTVFGMLNWNHQTLSYGQDLLAPSAVSLPGRAFVSNYQKLAMLRDGGISIIKPTRMAAAYSCDRTTGNLSPPDPAVAAPLIHDTQALYQSASWLFNSGRLKQDFNPSAPSIAPVTKRSSIPNTPES